MDCDKRSRRLTNLLLVIKKCIENGKYIITKHAFDRQRERFINLAETLYVLKNGYEEKRKTLFDKEHNVWKYAIKGKTLIDKKDVRVIVAFDDDSMLIITVIHIGNL